ncbi:hypothetical protein O77CONTIG1_01628 [Leptolyngbya sp. O-77]|nr:hypothetical protein O77CONTIG1_01628 [Leptolyngbya sp. O-77]
MGSSSKFANPVLLAVALSVTATFSAAAQSIDHQAAHHGNTNGSVLSTLFNVSLLASTHLNSPGAAASLQNSPLDRVRNQIEPQNSSYDPPVQGGPQSSQGSGTR